jgi:hypothetical protein
VCIAAGPEGAITVLSDGRWHVVTSPGKAGLTSAETEAISCPAGSASFCAIAGSIGDVQVESTPLTSVSSERPTTAS